MTRLNEPNSWQVAGPREADADPTTAATRPPINLSHPFTTGMPGGPPHGDADFTVAVQELHGHPFSITRMAMSVHTGTHMDAPRHFLPNGKTLDEYPCQVFMGPGTVLDVHREGAAPVTAVDLAAAIPEIRPGDIVFLCFGYGQRYGTKDYQEAHPYLADDAAEYLIGLGVPILGVDLPTPDAPRILRGESFGFSVHRILLSNDCLIIENLNENLAGLVGQRVNVVSAPVLIRRSDGAPTRVMVIPET